MSNIKTRLVVTLFLLFLCASTVCAADDFRWGSISCRTDLLGISGGRRLKNDWGFEFGGLLSGPCKTHTYPCPHSSYVVIDDNDSIGGLGADIIKFVPVGKFSPYVGAGIYWHQYQVVAKSTVTGYLYRQSLSNRFCLAYSAGSTIQVSDRWELGVGYHSERGINIQVGYNFKK